MQFGHFDDAKKEYVITSPKTPLPWINYLGSENFFSLISNTCGGYSFYKDAKLLRLTRYRYNDTPLDQNGRYYYIKDGDTVWNPGWQPTQTPLDSYECHHGLGYSRFVSSKNLVAAELTAFVPLADSCEVNRLMLTNNGTEEKTLALTSFVEFCFWNAVDDMTNFQRNFSIGEVEIQGSEIYHKTEYRERRRHYAVYAVNCPIDGYDTDRDAFLGAYRGNDRPETVLRGTAGNTVASGWGVIGSHHIDVTLKPGESRSFIFVLGYCENAADDKWEAPGVINKKPAKEMLSHYQPDEQVDFDNDSTKAQPLMEHLKRSFDFTVTHLGPHKLPLIGRADWNDCLNLNCFSAEPGEPFQTTGPSEGPVAESIFIAAMFVKYGKEYAAICRRRGNEEEAVYAEKEVEKVYQAVLDAGWDGEWFLRAYDAAGEKVGSNECEEGKIYIEPQGFCVLAEIGVKEGLAEKALTSVQNILETKYGVVLLQPAYTRYYLNLGEVSSYPPGYKENAGIFCHNNPWISIAEAVVGHGNRAFDLYRKICPAYIEDISEIHRTEPYVYSQMIAGKDAAHFGEAKNSWLTGTAAWTFVNVSQYILGIQPDYDGLSLNPCIPSNMEEFKIRRYFRGAWYNITFKNPEHREKGISSLTVNGTAVEGNLIPLTEGCTEYDVVAVM